MNTLRPIWIALLLTLTSPAAYAAEAELGTSRNRWWVPRKSLRAINATYHSAKQGIRDKNFSHVRQCASLLTAAWDRTEQTRARERRFLRPMESLPLHWNLLRLRSALRYRSGGITGWFWRVTGKYDDMDRQTMRQIADTLDRFNTLRAGAPTPILVVPATL